MKTIFEDLPNEILLNILEYIACPQTIYSCFHNLNQRFNHILQLIHLSLDLCTENQYQSLVMLQYFSRHCHHLRVDSVCPSIHLENFSQLRSLTIIEPNDAQIDSIHSRTLPMLEYLSAPASLIIFDCLFGNQDEQWTCLRSCNFYFSFFSQRKSTWQINSTLRSLTGLTCSRLTLSQLLSLSPCLKHLRVDMISKDESNWNINLFEKTLQSLRIGFHQFYLNDLSVLIGSNLVRLHIDLYDEQSTIDFRSLGHLLECLTPKLRQFNCDYRGREKSLNEIRCSHHLFQNIELNLNDIFKLKCRNMI